MTIIVNGEEKKVRMMTWEDNKMPKKTEAQLAAQREYDKRTGRAAQAKYLKEKCKKVCFVLTPLDSDIAERLETVGEPKATYIKRLIREDIAKFYEK